MRRENVRFSLYMRKRDKPDGVRVEEGRGMEESPQTLFHAAPQLATHS